MTKVFNKCHVCSIEFVPIDCEGSYYCVVCRAWTCTERCADIHRENNPTHVQVDKYKNLYGSNNIVPHDLRLVK